MFVSCAAALLLVLALLTRAFLAMEYREAKARADAQRQESVRLALWRMDSAIAPILTREASRPHFHYLSFYSPDRSYTRMLRPLTDGEVIVPSPLLGDPPQFCRLHFQVEPDGRITSPRVPTGNLLDLAEADYVTPSLIADGARELARLQAIAGATPSDTIAPNVAAVQKKRNAYDASSIPSIDSKEQQRSAAETLRRQVVTRNALEQGLTSNHAWTANSTRPEQTISELVPLWVERDDAEPELLLLRSVELDSQRTTQGVWIDWPTLRAWLCEQTSDLLDGTDIRPVSAVDAAPGPTRLASIPASLALGPAPAASLATITPTRATLLLAWLATVTSVAATGFGLRLLHADQRRRARFVSAVTHELRTPLTTFCLYSEMLADGMVSSDDKRQQYLQTLKRESVRLARIVENVLSHARLSDLRGERTTTPIELDQAVRAMAPRLEARLAEAGLQLALDLPGAPCTVDADEAALERILMNLADNAAKYAADATDKRVHLSLHADDHHATVQVSDHGPGIEPHVAKRLFQAFERGPADQTIGRPGLGLGLSLSRSLAREMGGTLEALHEPGHGAIVALTLPIVSRGTTEQSKINAIK